MEPNGAPGNDDRELPEGPGRSMKKSHSVTWSVDEPSGSEQDAAAAPARAKGKLRYSQLLQTIAGTMGGSEVSPAPPLRPAKAFDSSALPARPAMKQGSFAGSGGPGGEPLYPAVSESPSHAAAAAAAAGAFNPATGVSFQTHGGAALSSALGGHHIPPVCPPALPPTSPPGVGAADVTVQLSTMMPGAAGSKPRFADSSDTAHPGARDQDQPGLAAAHGSSGPGHDDPLSGGGGGFDDDAASSGLIIPPGSQSPLPPFSGQLTLRALAVGAVVGAAFCLLTTRLALVVGLAPNLQVAIAGACWALLRLYTLLLGRDMGCIAAVTAQEVAVAASAALAVASSAAAGGFGTVVLALQEPIAQRVGSATPGNLPSLVWSFAYWRLVCWLLLVMLGGASLMLCFRRALFARPSMTFATGAAAGQLLNTLHTPAMSYHGHKQMHRFTQWSILSFLFSGYTWVFSNPACNGFTRFPTFGLQALKYTWNWDADLSLVGLGLIAPVSVAWSLLVGAVVTWGLLWPVLSSKEGTWFPAGLPSGDTRGVYGYYLIVALALLLADAMYHIVRGGVLAAVSWLPDSCTDSSSCCSGSEGVPADAGDAAEAQYEAGQEQQEPGPGLRRRAGKKGKNAWRREALRIIETDTLSDASALQFSLAAMERALRQHIFMAEGGLAPWIGILGFVACSAAAAGGLPALFSPGVGSLTGGGATAASASGELRFYHVLLAAVLAAVAALANARGGGVTDINLADSYAKLGLLVFSAWAGSGVGGAGTGLVCGGLLLGACSSALSAMYAWRAGFMTMAHPMAVFVAHIFGLLVGCFFTPAAYLLFGSVAAAAGPSSSAAGLLSAADGFFASPLAAVFRSTAALATGGLSALPAHCVWAGLGAGVVALLLNGLRDTLPVQVRGLVPIPAAIGVVSLTGASLAVDLAVGAIARIVWRLRYPRSAEAYSLSVGTALITGPGMFAVARSLLAAFAVQPPICMSFSLAPAP